MPPASPRQPRVRLVTLVAMVLGVAACSPAATPTDQSSLPSATPSPSTATPTPSTSAPAPTTTTASATPTPTPTATPTAGQTAAALPAPATLKGMHLSLTGLGPLALDQATPPLVAAGYLTKTPDPMCGTPLATQPVADLGVSLPTAGGKLVGIWLGTATITTDKGAAVGMPMAQVQTLYGAAVAPVDINTDGGPHPMLRQSSAATDLLFSPDWEGKNVVSAIYLVHHGTTEVHGC